MSTKEVPAYWRQENDLCHLIVKGRIKDPIIQVDGRASPLEVMEAVNKAMENIGIGSQFVYANDGTDSYTFYLED
jgi:hypothetical protein